VASDRELKQVKEITNLECGEGPQQHTSIEAKGARKGMSDERTWCKQECGWKLESKATVGAITCPG
jgi:hypothetical protein